VHTTDGVRADGVREVHLWRLYVKKALREIFNWYAKVDLLFEVIPVFQEAKFKAVVVPVISNYGAIFERILTENGTGWLVGDSVSFITIPLRVTGVQGNPPVIGVYRTLIMDKLYSNYRL
jgi:hypothetical protein